MPDTGDPDRVIAYLNGLAAGEYRHMNPPPFRANHRVFTNRIVFKIHEVEHLLGRIARECHGQIVYLLRHPIPTTQSRRLFPRLDLFLQSRFYADFIGDGRRLARIEHLGREGNHLQRGLVSWCFENLLPLRAPDFDALFLTYEELILNPEKSCHLLLDRLQFGDRARMMRAFGQESTNIALSSAETREVLRRADRQARTRHLFARWQEKTSEGDLSAVSEILDLFGLDVYSSRSPLAHPRYLHFADTSRLAGEHVQA
jgi:hypothetical protein